MSTRASSTSAAAAPAGTGLRALLVPFLCFFLSGASGLVFEVIWTRKLTHVFGASTLAISTVLTAFMGGLALGSWVLGRYIDRLKFPLLVYAAMEAGVGVFALLVPTIVGTAYPPISRLITNHGGNSFDLFTLVRFVVVALVLLPPTTLMGATLPLLARHFVRQGGGLGQRVGSLYAVNTFGAVAGTFTAGFVLLPTLGLNVTNALAAATNVLLAALILAFRRPLLGAAWPASWRELLPSATPVDLPANGEQDAAGEARVVAAETEEAEAAREGASGARREGANGSSSSKQRGNRKRRASPSEGTAAATSRVADAAAEGTKPAADAARPVREEDLIDEPATPRVRNVALFAAAGSGFAAMAYEVILTRALDMTIGSSIYGFTIILMAFLVGIGGGSALASAVLKARPGPIASASVGAAFLAVALVQLLMYPNSKLSLMIFVLTVIVVMLCMIVASTWRRPTLALGAVQLLIGIAAACTYYFQDKIPRMFVYLAMVLTDSCDPARPFAPSGHVGTIQATSFLIAALCALPAALGMGAAFPLAVRAFARDLRTVGSDTSRVYSVNTIGSILGSLLTGFVLMPAVGAETAFYIAVTINLLTALALMLTSPGEEPAKYVLVPITAILLAIAATGAVIGRDGRLGRSQGRFAVFPRPWNQEVMTMGVFRLSLADGMIARRNRQCVEDDESDRERALDTENPIFYRDGVTTTVTVERWSMGDRTHYALKNNGKVDASNGDDMPTQVLVSAYPLLLHRGGPENTRVAIVGWGSGVTVGTTLQFPVQKVDVIELERATVDASRFFTEVNHLSYNLPRFPYVSMPRLNVLNNDGRNYLASTNQRYDVVISEPSNPWITGVSNLFTLDHFRAASQALAPNGIFLQWVQLYEMSPNNIKAIYRTFAEVFPYMMVFAADAYSSDTIVVGSYSPIELDAGRVDEFLATHPRVREAITPAHAQSASDLFARMIFGSREEVRQFAVIEEHNEGGVWRTDLRANGSGPCEPVVCRRRPAPINTDDNALIEFAAPRDLIGFDAFAGYTEALYHDDWPYGRVERQIVGLGNGETRVRVLSQLGISLLSAGRPSRSAEVLDQAASVMDANGRRIITPELERSARIQDALIGAREAPLYLEPPRAGPEVSREGEHRLEEAVRQAREAIAQGSFRTALAAFADVPATVRENSGPSLRLLYGYLLYKASASDGAEPRFGEAADELERLSRDEPEWVSHHPEVLFYIGRSRFRAGDFGMSVTALGAYVDMARRPVRDHEMPDVPRDLDEPAADSAPVTDEPGEALKDRRS